MSCSTGKAGTVHGFRQTCLHEHLSKPHGTVGVGAKTAFRLSNLVEAKSLVCSYMASEALPQPWRQRMMTP